MRRTRYQLSRRTFLRGAGGVSLALPIMASTHPAAANGLFPKRVVFFFVPEGCERTFWWPSAVRSPTDYDLETSLKPLTPFKGDLTIVRRIDHSSTIYDRMVNGTCSHGFVMKHVLTGGPNAPSLTVNGVTTPPGISIDQFLGRHLQGAAQKASYQMGVASTANPNRQRQMSFAQQNSPVDSEDNPYRVFEDLFKGVPQNLTSGANGSTAALHRRKQSILDVLVDDIRQLRCRIGSDDRNKLDAHLHAVRGFEQELSRLYDTSSAAPTTEQVVVSSDWNDRNRYHSHSNYPAAGKLQIDQLVAALAADIFRVGLFQWSASRNSVHFSEVNVPNAEGELEPLCDIDGNFHDAVGHQESQQAIERRKKIHTWYVEQFAYLIGRLKAIPEGNGTMLDNTVVVYTSDMSIANSHWPYNIPTVLAGRGGGGLKTGLYQEYSESGRRSSADLYTTICQAVGVPVEQFGEPNFRGEDRRTHQNKGVLTELLV
jgi:hypothetical protein